MRIMLLRIVLPMSPRTTIALLVGLVARIHGVMRRYERSSEGRRGFGCWPETLEQRANRAAMRRHR